MQTEYMPMRTSVTKSDLSTSSGPLRASRQTAPDAGGAAQPDVDCAGAIDNPYFLVRKRGERIETRGRSTAEFGHQIPSTTHHVADGIFAHWHWDGTRLAVKNDRYGFYPLFWFSPPGGGVCISSSLVSLLEQGAPTELDIEALSVFFRLGFYVGDDTPFSGIKTVPPNAVFEWENGKLECHGRYPQTLNATALSRDEAIDRYIDLFAKAMAKRAPDSDAFAVPISGGRDSRHILLELHRTGFEPGACVSALDNPPDPNEDARVAAALCQKLRLDLVIVNQQLSAFSAEVRKNPKTHFCTLAHGWYLALADSLNGRFGCVYDGIAGDVLTQSKFLNPQLDTAFRTRDVNAICDALLSRQTAGYSGIRGLLKGDLKAAMEPGVATKRLAMEVEKHLDGPNPVASFILWNRTRRAIALAPYSLLADIPRVYAPFLDHDLFDFLTTLPSSMLLDHSFHDDTIARAYPNFANFPYVDKAAPPADDTKVRARFLADAARMFLLKRPSGLMKNLLPRAKMLTSVLSLGHINPWVSPFILYLDQIETLMEKKRRVPSD
ncbi:hypothetical protein ACFPPA_00910 [Rhodanobacter ginsengisoli]|uniref:asparagine synthase (glutamine-hydrolyzing) n=1 Tax=Rhodanobacter ginsengisoli TaxID=418646 RepID=A0ABW0QKZ4_9GAMM